MKFAKLEGLKNDFIVTHDQVDLARLRDQAPFLCDRRCGIEADGILILGAPVGATSSAAADWQMRIINADGSEAEMCGNGIRCAAIYLHRLGMVASGSITVQTLAGPRVVEIVGEQVRVEMGCPQLTTGSEADQPIMVEGRAFDGTLVSMGNPHLVI